MRIGGPGERSLAFFHEETTMDRRGLLGWMAASAAGLLAAGTSRASTPDDDDEHEHHRHHEHHEHCEKMKALGECIRACNEASLHCLEQLKMESSDRREHHAKALELTRDCQEFCILAATLTVRKSPLAQYAHEACADACRCCAEECEKGRSEVMKDCAHKCRDCEEFCRSMSKAMKEKEKAA
jgi:hypothetical protein